MYFFQVWDTRKLIIFNECSYIDFLVLFLFVSTKMHAIPRGFKSMWENFMFQMIYTINIMLKTIFQYESMYRRTKYCSLWFSLIRMQKMIYSYMKCILFDPLPSSLIAAIHLLKCLNIYDYSFLRVFIFFSLQFTRIHLWYIYIASNFKEIL